MRAAVWLAGLMAFSYVWLALDALSAGLVAMGAR